MQISNNNKQSFFNKPAKNVCVQQAEDHKQVTNSDWRS